MDKMNQSQLHLHSEQFDLCRICLFEPESDRSVKFVHIFSPQNIELGLQEHIKEILNLQILEDEITPKIVCENCMTTLSTVIEMKKMSAESQVVIKYIAKKRFGAIYDELGHLIPNSKNKVQSLSQNLLKITTNSSSISSQSTSHHQLTTNQSNYSESNDDDDVSCQELEVNHDVIYISDSEDSSSDEQGSSKNHGLSNSKHYCTICRKIKHSNHNCSKNNPEFSTCLVPNCNILCRSMLDFEPHFRQHIGMSSGAIMCKFCFKAMKYSERDINGFHINCHLDNIFKCYTCNIVFKNISEFAYHKLKTHNGRLINAAGNYLCFYCENSSSDIMNINEHITHCRENKIKNIQENKNHELSLENSYEGNVDEKVISKRNIPGEKIPPPSDYVLFTCLKPNCNLIFQSFPVFKHHYREHFKIGHQYMCWQCCVPFFNINTLRVHQVKGNCRTPGMYKCLFCSEQFDDIQCLSIHKFTLHNGVLICKNKKNVLCSFCKTTTDIDNFKKHLVNCQLKNDKTMERTTAIPINSVAKKPRYSSFSCERCTKVCVTAAALSSHKKVHDPNRRKKNFKKKVNYGTMQNNGGLILENVANNKKTDTTMNKSSSRTARGNATNNVNYLDGWYFCENCPKKFNTRKGLSKHRSLCPNMKNIKKDAPKKYYCTKCKEYFTHLGFAEHWRITHGIRLTAKRRYPCNKCPCLFMYKIAILMHKEHVHGEIHNTINITNTDAVNCELHNTTNITNADAVNCEIEVPDLMTTSDAEEIVEMKTNEETFNIKTEYQETTNTLLDKNVQCETPVDGELENNVNGLGIDDNNDNINIENVDVDDPNINPNYDEITSKKQLNNKHSIVDNSNEINDNNKGVIWKTEFDDTIMDISQTEESQNGLVGPISVNGTQNMNDIVNEDETINKLVNNDYSLLGIENN